MDFGIHSGNKCVYRKESGIVIIGRSKSFWRNRKFKKSVAHPFHKVFISAQENYLYPSSVRVQKLGGVKNDLVYMVHITMRRN